MKKITLVGITHIDISSHEKVTRVLNTIKPDAVCLELDKYRLEALIENDNELNNHNIIDEIEKETEDEKRNEAIEAIKEEAHFAESFSSILDDIGFFESELARITQTDLPGKEMLVAYNMAKEIGAEIFLIDRSIHDISKYMEEEISPEEGRKFQTLIDELIFDRNIVAKPVENNNNEKQPLENHIIDNEDEEINLNEVIEIFKDEESLSGILQVFQQNFPNLYSILLEDRNVYMSREILIISQDYSNIVVVLGYGHLKEIKDILSELTDIPIKIAS
jgi:pheromone shutdown protein TraB